MKKENISLKICVGYHKPSLLLEGNSFVPVWGGKACSSAISKDGAGLSEQEQQWMNEHCLGDDTGDNISAKNRNYCEATILYWMWKNYDKLGNPDYIGFLQYRAQWCCRQDYIDTHNVNLFYNMIGNKFYTDDYQYKIGLTEHNLYELLKNYETIICESDFKKSVFDYKTNHFSQNIKWWKKTIEIVKSDWPQFYKYIEKYNEGSKYIWKNCFIMKREDFLEYCPFLFDILNKIDEIAKSEYYMMTAEQMRVPAYVSESLLGVFIEYLRDKNRKIKNVPLVVVEKPFASLCALPRNIQKISANAIPIVFISDSNYLKYTAVAIESIKENSAAATTYDIIILHDGKIPEHLQQRICKMGTQNISIRFFNAQYYIQKYNFKEFFHRRLNLMPYLKLFIHEILRDYERAVFLDGDILVLSDMKSLYNYPMKKHLIAAVQDRIMVYVKTQFWDTRRKYVLMNHKLKDIENYFNSGVLLLDLNALRKEPEIINMFVNEAKFRHNDRLHHDQDVLNFVLEERIEYLPQKFNFQACLLKDIHMKNIPALIQKATLDNLSQAEILHYDGDPKPWHSLLSRDWLMDIWWRYARKTPFYEELLCNNLNRCSVPSKTDANIVKNSSNYLQNRLNYYRCRLLSHLTFGKTKMHYKNKKEQLKKELANIRR